MVLSLLFCKRLITKLNFCDLRGHCTPNQKSACFVLYLKVINTFWKLIYASYSTLSKELKNSIGILVGAGFF